MEAALKVYSENEKHASLPEQIIVYRDGIGGPHMREKVTQKEVNEISTAIKGFSKNYNPEIIYILVDKNTSCRLFSKTGKDV